MEIKGPSAPPAVGVQAPSVRPTSPSKAAVPTTTPEVKPNTLQLSPALFTIGQLLEVVVTKIESNMLLLMLQNPILDENGQRINLQLKAPTDFPAQPGQQLTVRVKSIDNGLPQLQVLATRNEDLNPTTVLQAAQQQQRALPPLYANLAQLQQLQSKQQLDALPAPVREHIQTFWRSLPDTNQIQKPAGLKQAMGYSGPFLESALLSLARGEGRSYPALDVQTGLLRLAEAIRTQLETSLIRESMAHANDQVTVNLRSASTTNPTPVSETTGAAAPVANSNTAVAPPPPATPDKGPMPTEARPLQPQIPQAQARAMEQISSLNTTHLLEQLLQQTEGGLARILTQQLHAASHDPQRPLWLLELPVRHEGGVDVFDLRIHRDPEEQHDQVEQVRHTWTVMLGFDLQDLGPVRAQVSLMQNQISSFWWAERPATVDLFHQHLAQLQHRISAAGLKVNKLHCQLGIPDSSQPQRPVPISNIMLDEKT